MAEHAREVLPASGNGPAGAVLPTGIPRASALKKGAEKELDNLLELLKRKAEESAAGAEAVVIPERDPLQSLREITVNELVPVFTELVEKYSKAGISMQMDASNLLEGGREIRFEFSIGEYRARLDGTATSEGIAFHQTRYSPDCHGELSAGPMLRSRHLNAMSFREFVCDRMTLLLRSVLRRR
jgi:hypothetical protein